MRHVLVVANETVAGEALLARIRARGAADEDTRFTVIAPDQRAPRAGYVVYEDTRRAAAGRRLEKSVEQLREAGVAVHGLVVDYDPVTAVRDALASSSRRSTRSSSRRTRRRRSGWQRRDVLDEIRKVAGSVPVDHVVVDLSSEERRAQNVLVLANETVLGPALLDRIRERAAQGPATFLLVSPQSDPAAQPHPLGRAAAADRASSRSAARGSRSTARSLIRIPTRRRCRRCTTSGSTRSSSRPSPPERSGWLRRDLVERLRKDTGLPVEHVVAEQPAGGARRDRARRSRIRRATTARRGEPELARRRARARHVPLHRLRDHAVRRLLRRLLLPPRRQPGDDRWPPHPYEFPKYVAARQHVHPRHLELHDPLGAAVDQARQPRRAEAPASC